MSHYRGRFAPSPTGPLHFGSLIAALGSYLDARAQSGDWLVRMEDTDPPREMPGAADRILHSLEAHGLTWDESVRYQSRQHDAYEAALEQLAQQSDVFGCCCSRKQVVERAQEMGLPAGIYPGTCRQRDSGDASARAIRLRVGNTTIRFSDRLQGPYQQQLAQEVGDFVLRRADGLYAYQLAVVVDDADQGISDIVRGADLLDNTPRQIFLQRRLGLPTPRYMHLPVANAANGQKLSKQNLAPPLDDQCATANVAAALRFLNLAPPDELVGADVEELLQWAVRHWMPEQLPRQHDLSAQRYIDLTFNAR